MITSYEALIMFGITAGSYIFWCSIFYIIDIMSWGENYRLQKTNIQNLKAKWKDDIVVSLINLFIVIPIVLYGVYILADTVDTFILYRELMALVAYAFLADMWFYVLHRTAHHPKLYGKFHKLHHKYTAPVAINSLCATPLDYGVTSVMSIGFGVVLIPVHIYTIYIWLIITVATNTISHSGYDLPFIDNSSHDDHHRYFDCNYGNGFVSDKIFGTQRIKTDK